MDYEKKYKQLHTLISDLYPFMSEYCKEKVEGFFPELKELEDEKTRKEIVGYLKRNLRLEWAAWLEKQGEVESDKDDIEAEEKGIRKAFNKIWEEKQDKQKSQRMISAEAKEAMYDKPAWSEEDEEYINDLIGVFDGQQYQAHSDEEIVKWLKSIRLPYNKEWDENDEEMLRSIIATCELAEQDRDSSPARHLLEMQLDWLKYLKTRYTWKPSDEQIRPLEYTIDYFKKKKIDTAYLESLYNDLKKLREE